MPDFAYKYITEEEYLARERRALEKSEFQDGKIFGMAGAKRVHNLIVTNLILSLGYQLNGKECEVYPSDMRVKAEKAKSFCYPDVTVVCELSPDSFH